MSLKKCFLIFAVVLSCTLVNNPSVTVESRTIRCTHIKIAKCVYVEGLLGSTPLLCTDDTIKSILNPECQLIRLQDTDIVCCNSPGKYKETITAPDPPDVSKHPNLKLINSPICGRALESFDRRVTHGTETEIGEFPWMALLAIREHTVIDYMCGGTLINSRYVLTAAHCVVNMSVIGVRLGEHNMRNFPDCNTYVCAPNVQDYYLSEKIVHPDYDPFTFQNDIALLRLSFKANLTMSVRPVCLPTKAVDLIEIVGKYLTVTGWGVREDNTPSWKLQRVTVPVLPTNHCNEVGSYKRKGVQIDHRQICVGSENGKDSCRGDSGGPLKYLSHADGTGRYVQYGIVSYGPKLCGDGKPSIYTNIIYYMEWILENIRP